MGSRRRGNKRSCATKAQANSKPAQVGWPLATCYHMPHATRLGYRCHHSPAGLAVRHVQIPIEMKVEHAQLGYSALPQRYIRRRCSSPSSSSSSSCSRSSSSSSSCCCCSSSCIGVGTLRIRIHHDGATWCRTSEQAMRCGATTMTTTAAAAATMMSMMTMTIMMLMMFL